MPRPKDNDPTTLRHTMSLLVRRIWFIYESGQTTLDHVDICQMIAQEFNLFDNNNQFPIWLSRIVSGAMLDVSNNEKEI